MGLIEQIESNFAQLEAMRKEVETWPHDQVKEDALNQIDSCAAVCREAYRQGTTNINTIMTGVNHFHEKQWESKRIASSASYLLITLATTKLTYLILPEITLLLSCFFAAMLAKIFYADVEIYMICREAKQQMYVQLRTLTDKDVRADRQRVHHPLSAEFVLWIVLGSSGQDVIGDLEERCENLTKKFGRRRARAWYYFQVVRSCVGAIWPKVQGVCKLGGYRIWS